MPSAFLSRFFKGEVQRGARVGKVGNKDTGMEEGEEE